MGFFWTIVALVIALGLTWRYLGSYMAAVFDGPGALPRVGRAARLPAPRDRAPSRSRPGSATPARW